MALRSAFIIALMALAGVGRASPITFQYSGTISQVPIDDLYQDIANGSQVEISFTFDSAALDQIPDGTSASYVSSGVPFQMTFTLPGHVFTADVSLQIGILNAGVDQYTVLGTGLDGMTLQLFLQDDSGAVFADDSLPLLAPSLGAFTSANFSFVHANSDFVETQFDGLLFASDVPEPSSVFLLLTGLGGIVALRRAAKVRR